MSENAGLGKASHMTISAHEPLSPPACPPSEPRAPVSFGALKARQVRQRIAAGFYDRRDVARETARQILREIRREV